MIVNNKNNYFDVHLHTEPYYAVSFRTGLTVYEESLINGIYVSSGWNGSGYPFSVTSPLEYTRLNPLDFSMPQAFIVGIDGQFWGLIGFGKTLKR